MIKKMSQLQRKWLTIRSDAEKMIKLQGKYNFKRVVQLTLDTTCPTHYEYNFKGHFFFKA